jgi:pantothenate synthetase (EC 6.3.2.1)
MGALHEGHAALVKRCVAENDITVVSVFVNPTQFNNPDDLRLYPRTLEADCALLEKLGVDVVFAPDVEEMYPEPDTRVFDFGMLDKVMEGRFRPGHFNGVAQIVSKLFYAVGPDRAYFGEKDFQQLAIVREMVKQLQIPVEIVAVPIVREESGLALSSRNMRLTPQQRETASEIFKTLKMSVDMISKQSVEDTEKFVVDRINNHEALNVEYFEIVDGNTLQRITDWNDSPYVVGCIAVFCGEVRLIDNIRYK